MRWLLEPMGWIAGLVVVIWVSMASLALAHSWRFGPELAGVVCYSAFTIVMIFYPGRGNPGYNPFGAVARRVWKPLLRSHALALLVVIPAAALLAYVQARYAPRWMFAASFVFLLVLSFAQSPRSTQMLHDAAEAEREAAR